MPPVPSGYHTVSPYLIVPDAPGLFAFLSAAFAAREMRRTQTPDGEVLNIEACVGDSMIMVVQARAAHDARPASLYLYVPDVDAVHARAVAAGAVSLMEPADMFYGDRSAGVVDASGNHWWINTRLEALTSAELTSRVAAHVT
ncbi:MAG: VOC family protein [Gemmatimonadaceae bacterium]